MAEWLKAPHSKCGILARVSRVRIPPSPPGQFFKALIPFESPANNSKLVNKYDTNGAFGGGTVGYNVQMGGIVVGVEGDFGWMDLNGKGRIPSSNPAAHQDITLDGGLYADVTGRLGLAANRTLFYGKGGWAWFDGEARQKTTNPGFVTHGTDEAFDGWVAGAGIEHAFAPNVTFKVEYLHFDFGRQGGDQTSVTDPPIGFVYKNTTDLTAESVKAGVNFKFSTGR